MPFVKKNDPKKLVEWIMRISGIHNVRPPLRKPRPKVSDQRTQ
jgi:hypothetical protein